MCDSKENVSASRKGSVVSLATLKTWLTPERKSRASRRFSTANVRAACRARELAEYKLSVMCISMMMLFLVGNIPVALAYSTVYELLFPPCPDFACRLFRVYRSLTHAASLAAFSVNFLLYFAFNKRFVNTLLCRPPTEEAQQRKGLYASMASQVQPSQFSNISHFSPTSGLSFSPLERGSFSGSGGSFAPISNQNSTNTPVSENGAASSSAANHLLLTPQNSSSSASSSLLQIQRGTVAAVPIPELELVNDSTVTITPLVTRKTSQESRTSLLKTAISNSMTVSIDSDQENEHYHQNEPTGNSIIETSRNKINDLEKETGIEIKIQSENECAPKTKVNHVFSEENSLTEKSEIHHEDKKNSDKSVKPHFSFVIPEIREPAC